MTKLSLHFPRTIDIPNHETEVLLAPFALQTTVDGRALIALRFCTDSKERAYLQYFHLDTKCTSFYCLSDFILCEDITDMVVVNDRTIICGRIFDYVMVEFSSDTFSTPADSHLNFRILPAIPDGRDNEVRSFALGATGKDEYLYVALSEEEDIDNTGIKNFKVLRFNRRTSFKEDGVIVAHIRGCPPGKVWQNSKITVTEDGFIEMISRDLCNLEVLRLRIDPTKPEDQRWNRESIDVNFTDKFLSVEYAFGTSGDAMQQHCETSPQSVRVDETTLSCHPEGVFSHRFFRDVDGITKEQTVHNIFPSEARLSSMCVSPCHRFLFTINVHQEYDDRGYGAQFDEVWKCVRSAIVSDESSLENLARRSIIESMNEGMKRDDSYSDVLHNCPVFVKKVLESAVGE